MNEHTCELYPFLKAAGGNWRNALFVGAESYHVRIWQTAPASYSAQTPMEDPYSYRSIGSASSPASRLIQRSVQLNWIGGPSRRPILSGWFGR